MAYLTVNSQFTPYTFDELIKPYVMYDAAYQDAQARTDALLEKAAVLDDLSPTLDKETYDSYQEWKNQLKAASDELATSGLNSNTRRNLNALSNAYSANYLPTVDKLKTRGALIREQREYLQKHPNSFFDIDYSTTPIDKINTSSTFNTYDLDSISQSVATDSYSRLASGQKSLTPDEYMAVYGSGLTNDSQKAQVANAISSGMALASANHQQKEFENYMTKVRTMRTGSGRSSSTGGGGGSAVGNDINIPLPDGTSVQLKYNKKTKEYEYKNSKNKLMTISDIDNATTEDVVRGYYGGYYGDISIGDSSTKRILSDNSYSVYGPKGWVQLPKGGNTTYREFLKDVYGVEVSLPREDQKHFIPNDFSGKNLDKALRKGTLIEKKFSVNDGELSDYVDAPLIGSNIKKFMDLAETGLLADDSEITMYVKPDGTPVGYNVDMSYSASGRRLNEPIEQGWKDNLKSIKEAEAAVGENKGAFD